jgi:hypothetical protein
MAAALASSLTLSGCSGEEDVIPETEAQETHVSITIDTGVRTGTRSILESETDEAGIGYENYINTNDVHIFFFSQPSTSAWGDRLFEFTPSAKYKTSDGVYTMDGELTSEQYDILKANNFNFRITVTANWGLQSDQFDTGNQGFFCWNDVNAYEFDYSNYTPSAETPIPMYGVKTYSNVEFKKGKNTDLGNIDMLRAMAKIEVVLEASSKDTKLSDVVLSSCLAKGQCSPTAMYDNTVQDPQTVNINIPGNNSAKANYNMFPDKLQNVAFKKVSDTNYLIYVPEDLNTGSYRTGSATESYITLKINGSDYKLRFMEYDTESGTPKDENANPYNIIRNHHYLYTIIWTNHLTLKYKVIPWNEETADDITFN